MTDKYDSDQPEHTGDHEQTMAGEHETWTGEPPMDDFHTGEEAATVSEETDQGEAVGEAAVMQGEVAKKSLALPIIAGIGGLLFLGAVLYWQFNNNSVTAPMPMASVPPLSNQAPPPVTAADIAAPSPAPSSVPAMPATDVAPTTALETPSDKNMPKPVAAMPAMPMPAPAVVMPPKPPADAALPPSAPMPTTASAPAAVAAPPVVSTTDNSIDTRLSVLSAHVDDLQKSLTQATQQLSQVTAKLSASASSSTNTDSTIDDRLNKIEQKLMQMQHGTSSHVAAVADESTDTAPEKTYVHKHTHKAVYKKASFVKVKKTSPKTMKSMTLPKAKPPAMTNWVLRAATPDEAWVATDATSPELRHVQVGDSLSGIGQVRAIHQNGDNWVVEGTSGTIQ